MWESTGFKGLIVEESTLSNIQAGNIFNKNCPQFGKDIIKNQVLFL